MTSRIILALDGMDMTDAFDLSRLLENRIWGVKVNDLLDQAPVKKLVRHFGLGEYPKLLMADPKLHDIPNTVRNRMFVYADSGAFFTTIHLKGGERMVQAALEAAEAKTVVIGVTELTSDEVDPEAVARLAEQAISWGVPGIVCSGKDLSDINPSRFEFVITPGVRSPGIDHNDQKRVVTPAEAISAGATHVVIGREILRSKQPYAQAMMINADIRRALEVNA